MINYIILAHKNPLQLKRLIDALHIDDCFFYIHINAPNNIEPFKNELQHIKNVIFLEDAKRETIIWGGIGLVHAPLNAMRQIIADGRNGYCVLLSGQDYPLKNKHYIHQFLTLNANINYIDVNEFPVSYWSGGGMERLTKYKIDISANKGAYVLLSSIYDASFYTWKNLRQFKILLFNRKFEFISKILKKRKHPQNIKPYGGSAWWALPVETAKKILKYIDDNPQFLAYHKNTILPDEIFFQTIVMALLNGESKEIIKPALTYTNFTKPNVVLPVTFTLQDRDELMNQPATFLFARKFDIDVDEKILDVIDDEITD